MDAINTLKTFIEMQASASIKLKCLDNVEIINYKKNH